MYKIVIIGAGQAGAGLALELRELGFKGEINIIGDEIYLPYERPELSKRYVKNEVDFEKLVILNESQANEKNIKLNLGIKVENIDIIKKEINWDGGKLEYDKLIFATGGSATKIKTNAVFSGITISIRSKADADELSKRLLTAKKVAVIGGGWLGLELAATCKQVGCEVHIYEASDRLCSRVSPTWLSNELEKIQEENGVQVHLGELPQMLETGDIKTSNDVFRPDLIIVSIGMTANDQLAVNAGINCDDGILVAEDGHTNDSSVLAIGDCARYSHLGNVRKESWQNANHSAEDAARAISNMPARKAEPDWFWSNQYLENVQMIGNCSDELEQTVRIYEAAGSRVCFFHNNTSLLGCIALNYPRDIAATRKVISQNLVLNIPKLKNSNIPLKDCLIKAS